MHSGWGKSGSQPHSPDWGGHSARIPEQKSRGSQNWNNSLQKSKRFEKELIMIATIENRLNTSQGLFKPGYPILLDPERKSLRVEEFEERLSELIIGQERAVRSMSSLYQIFLAGMNQPDRPLGSLLFLGPTGSGKTHTVEAAAEILLGARNVVLKIDCAEFQHSHEIAKLVGSPPGYLGHRETHPLLSQENLDRYHTEDTKLSFVLFDEIEKASDALWQLLLGILDKATLTLGDNQHVDFSRTVIVMTSNLGAREISELISGGIGFAPAHFSANTGETEVEQKIYHTALEAARRKFSPEFMNRIDKVVVYRPLKQYHLQQIVDLELQAVQDRITHSVGAKFVLQCSDAAQDMLLREGLDFRYGARHIKRSIERFLVYPLSNLIATEQMQSGDVVYVDVNRKTGKLAFMKYAGGSLVAGVLQPASEVMSKDTRSSVATLPFSRAKGAPNGQNTPAA
jgi:ATP-dependent Clp protease ATP-binding subunit ClpA